MKKSILFLFTFIPLFASCNQNSNGFPNPFPEDEYESKKIGFNLADNERIKRVLSTKETELLDKTINNLEYINKNLLKQENGEIHERDYTRAFAGVFGQGYTSSNMMKDETFKSFYQEKKPNDDDPEDRERKETISNIKSTYDYAYGQNTSETNVRTIRYLATLSETDKMYYEFGAEIPPGDTPPTEPTFTIERKYEIIDSIKDLDISSTIIASKEKTEDLYKPLYITQSSYVFKPTASDPVAGAFDDNHIIVIHEEHTPSDDYALPDGRTYKTAVNSLTVTSLVKNTDKIAFNDEPEQIGDYYLVERSRVYTEKAITSDVIQPNVPVTFLTNPIVINYKEEIHNFFTSTSMASDTEIKPVEIKS